MLWTSKSSGRKGHGLVVSDARIRRAQRLELEAEQHAPRLAAGHPLNVPRAEFEEKEFEQAAVVELADGGGLEGRGAVLSAGQVLERIVGYDAATAPATRHAIWELLGVPRPPGLRLVPEFWIPARQPPAGRLPGTPVSLILQFKRPEYLVGHQAAQWRMWQQPFFRFTRTHHQHEVLLHLERRLEQRALVRYAAPAFWRRGELEAAHLRREVLRLTGFAAPNDFGRHRVWTYIKPGTDGRGNPTGRNKPFPTFEELIADAFAPATSSTEVVPARSLEDHLLVLADVARERRPALRTDLSRWDLRLRVADLPFSSRTRQLIVALTAITSLTSSVGATWRVLMQVSVDT
jgi:hypothetical protein